MHYMYFIAIYYLPRLYRYFLRNHITAITNNDISQRGLTNGTDDKRFNTTWSFSHATVIKNNAFDFVVPDKESHAMFTPRFFCFVKLESKLKIAAFIV